MLVLSCNSAIQDIDDSVLPTKADSIIIANEKEAEPLGIVKIYLNDKSFYSDSWHDYLVFSFIVQNNSGKDIRAVRGEVVFINAFNEELHFLELKCEQLIPACKSVEQEIKMIFRPYVERDVTLKERSLEGLKIECFPKRIIFTDNST